MKKKRVITHGEVNLFECADIPKDAKRVYLTEKELIKNGFIVGHSESGNHHCIEVKPKVEFYEKEGILYMKNLEETSIYCTDEKRHDTVTIPKSNWFKKPSKEVDHLLQIKRNVAD